MSRFKMNEKIRMGYRYDILYENDRPVYYVDGSMFHLAPKLTVHTMEPKLPISTTNRFL